MYQNMILAVAGIWDVNNVSIWRDMFSGPIVNPPYSVYEENNAQPVTAIMICTITDNTNKARTVFKKLFFRKYAAPKRKTDWVTIYTFMDVQLPWVNTLLKGATSRATVMMKLAVSTMTAIIRIDKSGKTTAVRIQALNKRSVIETGSVRYW